MKKGGFTLIELLVVISIIGVLSSVVLAGLSSARVKARDARRQADMHAIYTALNLFYDQYGCLPITSGSTCIEGYNGLDAGSWDYSSQGGFLSFLVTAGYMPNVPVDPVNNMTGDASPTRTFAYSYYCYPAANPNPGLNLGYWPESGNWTRVKKSLSNPVNDSSFLCK